MIFKTPVFNKRNKGGSRHCQQKHCGIIFSQNSRKAGARDAVASQVTLQAPRLQNHNANARIAFVGPSWGPDQGMGFIKSQDTMKMSPKELVLL